MTSTRTPGACGNGPCLASLQLQQQGRGRGRGRGRRRRQHCPPHLRRNHSLVNGCVIAFPCDSKDNTSNERMRFDLTRGRVYAMEPSPLGSPPGALEWYQLPLAAGTGTVAKAAALLGMKTVTLDWAFPADINRDLREMSHEEIGVYDIVWWSPVCATESYLRTRGRHPARDKDGSPLTDTAREDDATVDFFMNWAHNMHDTEAGRHLDD
jgi:hypothetical protein